MTLYLISPIQFILSQLGQTLRKNPVSEYQKLVINTS